jgi:hypothetical protein
MSVSEISRTATSFPLLAGARVPSAVQPFDISSESDICPGLVPTSAEAVELRFREPHLNLAGSFLDLKAHGSGGGFSLYAEIERNASLELSVAGKRLTVRVRPLDANASSEFVAASLLALYGLSREGAVSVALAGDEFLVCGGPKVSLIEMSQTLRWRDLAYKLMVIERAAGVEFRLPPVYSSKEVGRILFLYQAITRRSFEWPIFNMSPGLPVPLKATLADQRRVQKVGSQASYLFRLPPLSDRLFGEQIQLGEVGVMVRRPIFLNANELLDEISVGDGHEVIGQVTSLEASLKINTTAAPVLPSSPWNDSEQRFIEIGPFLSSRLADEYNSLAASTLAGLSDAEKAEITARPELDLTSSVGREESE